MSRPSLLIFWIVPVSVYAGKSIYGKVTEVKSADVLTLDYGTGQYSIRIAGIDAPEEGLFATEAKQFVANLVLGKGNCSPPGGYVDCTRDAPARVRRIASRAPMERRRAVSMTERMSA